MCAKIDPGFSWQAQRLVTWRRCCCRESQCQGCASMTPPVSKVVAGAAFVSGKAAETLQKSYFLSFVKIVL